jgi:Ca2+-binding RTX toxin-like protein
MSLETAASGFTGSPEFQSTYGALDDTQFVTLLYSNVLHRAPDPDGQSFWLNQLSTGSPRSDVVLGFSESSENQAAQQAAVQDYVHFVTPGESNVLDGGTGTDTVSYALAQGGVTVNLSVAGPQETFGAGIDTLTNIENVTGSAFADTLIGNGGANVLTGGAGGDTLSGHAPGAINPTDANTFAYTATTDSGLGVGNFDTITDFVAGLDKIDFSALSGLGNALVSTNTAPTTIDANTLLAYASGGNTILYANHTAAAEAITSADMEIHLTGVTNLSDNDILHHA